MNRDVTATLAEEFSLDPQHVAAAVSLLEEQNTVPFVARYRRDRTGGMDEPTVRRLLMRHRQLAGLQQRREQLIEQVAAAGKLTDELRARIEAAADYHVLHDLEQPFAPPRRTLATIAREKGLEPLAMLILANDPAAAPLEEKSRPYIDPLRQVANVEEVLVGVAHIIAEHYAQQPEGRAAAREVFRGTAKLCCRKGDAPEDRARAYREFFDFSEPAETVAAHRMLAINRGERHAALSVWIDVDEAAIARRLAEVFRVETSPFAPVHCEALADALRRTILPDLEKELRHELTERAERHAVDVLARNLRSFLLTPPLLNRAILGILPGHRTGCTVAVIDASGNLAADALIHPHAPMNKRDEAKQTLAQLARERHVELIAIAAGAASRETEALVSELLAEELKDVRYAVVSSVGTKAYMTSREAKDEFPDRAPEVRAAVSIARRLREPLDEMVKIDPRFLGIGPYQYDVRPKLLRGALGAVVESVANEVGADVNTASARRLRYISGLDTASARKIVDKRKEIGRFNTLFQLLTDDVLGAKALYQAAGFLTLEGGGEPLDATAVHIEQYDLARAVLAAVGFDATAVADPVMRANLRQRMEKVNAAELAEKLKADPALAEKKLDPHPAVIGQIVAALAGIGVDPRKDQGGAVLRRKMVRFEELAPGMKLIGVVRNVVDFGAFVDIGLKEDGLVHVSQLTRQFVKDPREVVSPGEVIACWLVSVDTQRQRISLTMIDPAEAEARARAAVPSRRSEGRPARPPRQGGPPGQPAPAGARGREPRRGGGEPRRGGPPARGPRPGGPREHGRGPRDRGHGGRDDRARFKPAMGSTLGDLLREVQRMPAGGGAADSSHIAKRLPKPKKPHPPKKAAESEPKAEGAEATPQVEEPKTSPAAEAPPATPQAADVTPQAAEPTQAEEVAATPQAAEPMPPPVESAPQADQPPPPADATPPAPAP